MCKKIKYILTVIIIAWAFSSFSQGSKIDSLLKRIASAKEDTAKINILNAISFEMRYRNYDSAFTFAGEALKLSDKLNWLKGKAYAHHNLGLLAWSKNDYPASLNHYDKALVLWDSLLTKHKGNNFFLSRKAATIGNIGIVHKDLTNYPLALDYYFRALKIYEQLNERNSAARVVGNIAGVYHVQKKYDKARDYYVKAINIAQEFGKTNNLAIQYGNLGNVYNEEHKYELALQFYNRALSDARELGNIQLEANTLGNLGAVYNYMNEKQKALDFHLQAVKLLDQIGDLGTIAINLGNIGNIYLGLKKYSQAEKYLKQSLKISEEISDLEGVSETCKNLSEMYVDTRKTDLAFKYFKKHITARDSIVNTEQIKKQTQIEMNYVFYKQQMADSIQAAELLKQEAFKHSEEIKQQKFFTYGGVTGFILMVIVAIVSFRAYRSKQKTNEIISLQKHLVEQKQKEITDSIRYAKRIQQTLMPSEKYIDKNLKKIKKTKLI